jgi:hypothetical protein
MSIRIPPWDRKLIPPTVYPFPIPPSIESETKKDAEKSISSRKTAQIRNLRKNNATKVIKSQSPSPLLPKPPTVPQRRQNDTTNSGSGRNRFITEKKEIYPLLEIILPSSDSGASISSDLSTQDIESGPSSVLEIQNPLPLPTGPINLPNEITIPDADSDTDIYLDDFEELTSPDAKISQVIPSARIDCNNGDISALQDGFFKPFRPLEPPPSHRRQSTNSI